MNKELELIDEEREENAIDQRWLRELENASAKFHISKLNAELLEIRAEYEKAFAKENEVVEDTIKESYTDRYDHMAFEIQKGYGVGFKVAGVDSEKLDKVIKKPWASDGKNFSDRIWTKKEQMVDTLHGELIRSMLTGGNTKDAIKIMQRYVSNDVKNAKYAAARLIRTESSYFASEGQKECFKDLDVEKYEIVATLDNRTSDICQGMDGQVFEMKDFETGVTAPPFHVNCRSTTAPYFDDEFAKGERAARDAEGKTYYVPSDMTYKEWKGKQDEIVKSDNKYNSIVIPDGYDVNKHSKEILKSDAKNGKIVPGGNEYVDLKTIQEAEDYAKNTLGITAIYDGLDIDIINETNKSLTDAIQYSDKIVNYIHAVGCAQLREEKLREELRIELEKRAVNKGWDLKSPRVQNVIEDFIKKQVPNIPPNSYAYNMPISKIPDVGIKNIKDRYAGIFINKKYGKDINVFNEHLKDDVITKFHPIGCDKYKATIDHEIGHVLDVVFDLSNDPEVIKEWNDFNKLSVSERNDALSEYAYNNKNKKPIEEFIAEAYSEYKNNPNPRNIAKRIGEIIERKSQNEKNI